MKTHEDAQNAIFSTLEEMGFHHKDSELNLTSSMKQIKMDSLNTLEFLMLLEENHNVEITTDEFSEVTTIKQFADLIIEKSKATRDS